jgi:predicted dehydrogenase
MFGAHCEGQALAQWQARNGVYGFVASGPGGDIIGCHNRIVGEEGVIEIGRKDEGMPALRISRAKGESAGEWETIDCGDEGMHGPDFINRTIADLVESLEEGREPELSARKALNATEIIFAAYESSRKRGRIDLPLTIDDNPLTSMVESGMLKLESDES